MKIKALIFDYDGLLVNTQEHLAVAYDRLFEKYGKKMDPKEHERMMGTPGINNLKYLKKKYDLPGTPEELLAQRRFFSVKLFEEELALMEGVTDLLVWAKKAGLKLGIGTGTTTKLAQWGLTKMGIQDYFEVIVTMDDIKGPGKPDPEVFLLAAEGLRVKPSECVVVGDAPNDVLAAKAAGMRAVYVPDIRYSAPTHDQADVILKSLKELTQDIVKQLENESSTSS